MNISKYRHNYNDWTGKTINNLTFIEDSGKRNTAGNALWLIRCFCGVEFISKPSRVTAKTTVSCGCYRRKVSSEAQKKRLGIKHPRWNPDKTYEDRVERRCFNELKIWRNLIYRRDNYTCLCCGQRGGYLQAHHMNGWHWCEEERFDINNGVTLCRE